MENLQRIKIEGKEYLIIDSIQDFRAEDSFIHRKNKLAQFKGNGESKKHVGTYSGEKGERMSNFFNYSTWGLEHYDSNKKRKTFFSAKENGGLISENRCFFSKSNFLKYLNDAKTEYFAKEQHYHNNISEYYNERLEEVNNLGTNQVFFSIYDASDNLSQKQNRGYVRSDDSIWKLWRELILPSISYLSILKLVPIDNKNAEPLFYFRILLDYQFRSFVHPKLLETEVQLELELEEIDSTIKKTHRKGSEKYRREVINYMPQCPFTKITDERLLIASHIKPYSICIKNNENEQALDYLNGLALSPTYDKLFDQGYITFTDTGELICGTQLSSYTWEKLKINPNAKNKMRIFPEDRELYLDYHRNNVFQDDINDLI
jgi:putative restriction endonuclease